MKIPLSHRYYVKPKDYIEEKIKHTAKHIGVISVGALKTLIREIQKKDEQELLNIVDRNTTIGEIREEIIAYYKS